MPFARYFCIFINVGFGEGANWVMFWRNDNSACLSTAGPAPMVFLKFNGRETAELFHPVTGNDIGTATETQ